MSLLGLTKVEPSKLDLFETIGEVSKLELHTPEVQLIDSSSVNMWKKEDNNMMESGALVTLPDRPPKTLADLVEFLDVLPSQIDETADHRRTNHCTTFGTEDLWPL